MVRQDKRKLLCLRQRRKEFLHDYWQQFFIKVNRERGGEVIQDMHLLCLIEQYCSMRRSSNPKKKNWSALTVEPLLSGHPQGKGKWPLNRGWPLNKGSSGISQRLTRNINLLNYKHVWRHSYFPAQCTCPRRNYVLNNHRKPFQENATTSSQQRQQQQYKVSRHRHQKE